MLFISDFIINYVLLVLRKKNLIVCNYDVDEIGIRLHEIMLPFLHTKVPFFVSLSSSVEEIKTLTRIKVGVLINLHVF